LLHRNVQRFRAGLALKAHRLLHHSTLGLRVIKKKGRTVETVEGSDDGDRDPPDLVECLVFSV